jgi:hypothetical protein
MVSLLGYLGYLRLDYGDVLGAEATATWTGAQELTAGAAR